MSKVNNGWSGVHMLRKNFNMGGSTASEASRLTACGSQGPGGWPPGGVCKGEMSLA